MRNRNLIYAVIILVSLISLTLGFRSNFIKAEAEKQNATVHLDEHVPELLSLYDIPGASIALIKNGEVTWSGQYGYQDVEEGKPVTSDTFFRAESITKSVTAWGVMNLVEQGYIELDDPVENI